MPEWETVDWFDEDVQAEQRALGDPDFLMFYEPPFCVSEIGNDREQAREALVQLAAQMGYSEDELPDLLTKPSGRPGVVTAARVRTLAMIVARLRDYGAHLETIGQVIGRSSVRTVAKLEARGRCLFDAPAG